MSQSGLSVFSEEVLKTMPLIMRSVFKKGKNDLLVKGKITLPQCIVLDILDSKNNVKMKDIAGELNVTLPATTGLIDRLVKLGMVKRAYDAKDRRIVFIVLTAKGKSGLTEIRASRKKTFEEIFSKLTQKERDDYLQILRKLKHIVCEKGHED